MDNKHLTFLGILLLLLICGSIYYFQDNNTADTQDKSDKKTSNSGIVLGDSTGLTQTKTQTTDTSTITSGEAYYAKVNALRKPINDAFDDMNSKVKYKTLFSEEDAGKSIEKLSSLIDYAIEQFKILPIDAKFKDANDKELESLGLLKEAMDAFTSFYNSKDQTEQQKFSDIYSYKIEQSNKILEDIAIPK